MSWRFIAITIAVLLGVAIVGAAGLAMHVKGQRFDGRSGALTDHPAWRDLDEPYRAPAGQKPPSKATDRPPDGGE